MYFFLIISQVKQCKYLISEKDQELQIQEGRINALDRELRLSQSNIKSLSMSLQKSQHDVSIHLIYYLVMVFCVIVCVA